MQEMNTGMRKGKGLHQVKEEFSHGEKTLDREGKFHG